MRILRIGTLLSSALGLALGLSLTGCNRTENASPTVGDPSMEPSLGPKDAAFSMEAHAIKTREIDHAKMDSSLRDLRSRYGYPVLSDELSSSNADPKEVPSALGKTAANAWLQTRSVNIGYHFAHSVTIWVPANATLKVWAQRQNIESDPLLVGFYSTKGNFSGPAHKLIFVGFSDDVSESDLNSYFKWKNNTGVQKSIRLVSWSFPPSFGVTTMSYSIAQTGLPTKTGASTMWVSGWTDFDPSDASDYAHCTGPSTTRVRLKKYYGPATGYGTTVLAFNQETMRGGFISDSDDLSMDLADVLPRTGASFLLGFFTGDGYQPDPMSDDATAVKKLDAHYGASFYFGEQKDLYKCP